MTNERLAQIEALLTAKLFPHGGWDEARELIEAVRLKNRQIDALRKALFSGEAEGGAVDLSVAAHVQLLQSLGDEHDSRWAVERTKYIRAAADLLQPTPPAGEGGEK